MTNRSKIWDYDPKEITKLLSEFAKPTICEQLGIGETTLKNYIKAHQIQYTKPNTNTIKNYADAVKR